MLSALCLLGSVAPCLFGAFVASAITGNERYHLQYHDKPASYGSLTFSDWIVGPGELRPSEHLNIPEGSTIARHRIGRHTKFVNEFTYYEAEYRLPDGSTRITHASGPKPMFGVRKSVAIGSLIVMPIVAILLFLLAAKLTRQDLDALESIESAS